MRNFEPALDDPTLPELIDQFMTRMAPTLADDPEAFELAAKIIEHVDFHWNDRRSLMRAKRTMTGTVEDASAMPSKPPMPHEEVYAMMRELNAEAKARAARLR